MHTQGHVSGNLNVFEEPGFNIRLGSEPKYRNLNVQQFYLFLGNSLLNREIVLDEHYF